MLYYRAAGGLHHSVHATAIGVPGGHSRPTAAMVEPFHQCQVDTQGHVSCGRLRAMLSQLPLP